MLPPKRFNAVSPRMSLIRFSPASVTLAPAERQLRNVHAREPLTGDSVATDAQGELPIGDGQAFEIPQAGVRDPNAVKVQK